MRAIVGPRRPDRARQRAGAADWTAGVNSELEAYAQRYRNVELANWQAAIAPSVGELAPDEIHPGGPLTGGIYCDAVADALQRLAELPPLRTDPIYDRVYKPVYKLASVGDRPVRLSEAQRLVEAQRAARFSASTSSTAFSSPSRLVATRWAVSSAGAMPRRRHARRVPTRST